jgi:hypothetical protein
MFADWKYLQAPPSGLSDQCEHLWRTVMRWRRSVPSFSPDAVWNAMAHGNADTNFVGMLHGSCPSTLALLQAPGALLPRAHPHSSKVGTLASLWPIWQQLRRHTYECHPHHHMTCRYSHPLDARGSGIAVDTVDGLFISQRSAFVRQQSRGGPALAAALHLSPRHALQNATCGPWQRGAGQVLQGKARLHRHILGGRCAEQHTPGCTSMSRSTRWNHLFTRPQ